MQRRSTTWLALAAVAAFSATPLAAQDVVNPPPVPTPAAADDKPADVDIGPPGDIVVPSPEEVVPAEGTRVDGGRIGGGTGDLNIRAPTPMCMSAIATAIRASTPVLRMPMSASIRRTASTSTRRSARFASAAAAVVD